MSSLFNSYRAVDGVREEWQPTADKQRIALLDVLRGLAIFGILIVNIQGFSFPPYVLYGHLNWWSGTLNHLVQILIFFFVVGKFYTLFSFLFGLGLAVQLARAEDTGIKFVPIYRRRLIVLFIIGAIHALLIWWGDILHIYALLGFVLLLFRNSLPKVIFMGAIISLALPLQLILLEAIIGTLGNTTPDAVQAMNKEAAQMAIAYKGYAQNAVAVYPSGSYLAIVKQNWQDLKLNYQHIVLVIPHVFAMFLIGLYAGRRDLLNKISNNLSIIRRALWLAAGFGIVCNLFFVLAQEYANPYISSALGVAGGIGYILGSIMFCFVYVAIVILLMQSERQSKRWRKILSLFIPVGRMALTNYLAQSLISVMIFYGYGAGFYNRIGPALSFVLVVGIFGLQVCISHWWMYRFQFGPVEWVWRTITYWQWQPMHLIKKVG